jgi:tRNA(Ile)-lysidine synthase
MSGALDERCFVGAHEAVGGGFCECLFEEREAETLRGLRLHDEFAGNGRRDDRAMRCALDLLDGVDGRHAHDGGAMLYDCIDGALDGGDVDEGPDGVVYQHNVVLLRGQRGQGVGDGFLALLAAFDDVNAAGKSILGDLSLNALNLSFAHGDIDCSHSFDRGIGAQGVDEDGDAVQSQKLLGLRTGHPGAQSGGGQYRENLHNCWSIQRRAVVEVASCGSLGGFRPYYPLVRTRMPIALPINTTPLKPGMRLAVGLSGGADSVALLRALALRSTELGLVIHAAHLHHGLRGDEADADREFCRELAAGLGIPFHESRVDTGAESRANAETGKGNETIEEAARRLRYAWFRRLMAAGEVDAVATAHTLDDQAETVLARFLRGAWTEGLAGIHPAIEFAEGRVVRPMLAATRAQVEEFLHGLGQMWREDSSNRHLTYTRNRIRHQLLPLLETWNPRLREHMAQMATLALDEEAWWSEEMKRLAPQLLMEGRPVRGGGRAAGEGLAVDVTRFAALDVAVQRRLLREAAGRIGAALDYQATEALRRMALEGNAGQKLEPAAGLFAERTPRELRLAASGPAGSAAKRAGEVPEYPLSVPGEIAAPAFGLRVRVEVSAADGGGGQDRGTATLRNWKAGDRVRLRHSSAPRKVKEVLERMRVTGSARAAWPVLEMGGEIVWMQGVDVEAGAGVTVRAEPLADEAGAG